MYTQLELDFASTLASALDEPEQADIAWMCAVSVYKVWVKTT